MIEITTNYRGQLATGKQPDTREVEDGTTLATHISAIAEQEGGDFRHIILDADGAVRRTLLVAVDGEQVLELDTPIPPGAREITLIPPIAGG